MTVQADAGDEALMTEGAKVFQTIQAKCQSKRTNNATFIRIN